LQNTTLFICTYVISFILNHAVPKNYDNFVNNLAPRCMDKFGWALSLKNVVNMTTWYSTAAHLTKYDM